MKLHFLTKAGANSVNKKIFRAALVVGILTLVARFGTIFKELIVARFFGRGDALDAFLIAFLLPAFIVTIVTGTVGPSLIPVFVEVQQNQGRSAAEKLLSSMSLISAVVLGIAAICMGIFAPYYLPYVAHGFSQEKLHLTRELMYPLLPWIVLSGTAQLITYVLNAGEKFALPALVPLVTPVIVVALIFFTRRNEGPFVLSAGALTGGFLEFSLLLGILKAHGLTLRTSWEGFDEHLRTVLRQCAPLLGGTFLMASTSVINQSVATILPAGSVSAFAYASRIITGIIALGAVALSTATLPYFSRMVNEKDWAGCRHTLKRYSALLAFTTIPFTLIFIACSHPLVRILYQRGAFTAADTELVARVQSFFAIQIPFQMFCALLVRFISAMRRHDLIMYGAIINVFINIVLDLMFVKKWGVSGIALASSLVFVVSFVFLATASQLILTRTSSASLRILPFQQVGK
ncbi:MAG TPA: lipid II flippase MurJ [Candidatus Angelobacter sp.]|jgi:putative peptidoglycan lipid II flippase